MRLLGIGSVLSVIAVLAPIRVQAAEVCIPINATASQTFLLLDPGGSPVLVRGEITGGGVLHGTYGGVWTLVDFDADTLTFEETMEISTLNGTVSVWSEVVVDRNTGEYRSTSSITGGTGRFAGATGATA